MSLSPAAMHVATGLRHYVCVCGSQSYVTELYSIRSNKNCYSYGYAMLCDVITKDMRTANLLTYSSILLCILCCVQIPTDRPIDRPSAGRGTRDSGFKKFQNHNACILIFYQKMKKSKRKKIVNEITKFEKKKICATMIEICPFHNHEITCLFRVRWRRPPF